MYVFIAVHLTEEGIIPNGDAAKGYVHAGDASHALHTCAADAASLHVNLRVGSVCIFVSELHLPDEARHCWKVQSRGMYVFDGYLGNL